MNEWYDDNVVASFRVGEKASEGAWNSLISRVVNGESGQSFSTRILGQETEYMKQIHGEFVSYAVDKVGRWKMRAYTVPMHQEKAVKDAGLKYKVRKGKKADVLEVEGLPGAYRSAKSVVCRALDAGLDPRTCTGKTAVEKQLAARKPPANPFDVAMKHADCIVRWRDSLSETEREMVVSRVKGVM